MTATIKIKARPPRPNHGPLFSSRWIFSQRRWAMWMNDRGRAEYDKFMAAFDGRPVKILVGKFKSLHRRAGKCRDRDAIHQAAMVGLLHAVRCWKPDGGAALNTTAIFHIAQQVSRELNGGVDQRARLRNLSLHELGPEAGFGLLDTLAAEQPDPEATDSDEVTALGTLLSRIPERERDILIDRFSNGRSLDAIGQQMGLSKERIRQLQKRAISRVRRLAKASGNLVVESAEEKKASRGGRSSEADNIRRIRTANVRNALARTPGLTVYQIAEETLLPEYVVANILKSGRRADPPAFRSEGEARRFSTTPVRWFLTDQPS